MNTAVFVNRGEVRLHAQSYPSKADGVTVCLDMRADSSTVSIYLTLFQAEVLAAKLATALGEGMQLRDMATDAE